MATPNSKIAVIKDSNQNQYPLDITVNCVSNNSANDMSESPSKRPRFSSAHEDSISSIPRFSTSFVHPPSDLFARLNSLLPQLAEANSILEEEVTAGTVHHRNIENVNDDEDQYIEMNLGLGVLEEKRGRKRRKRMKLDNEGGIEIPIDNGTSGSEGEEFVEEVYDSSEQASEDGDSEEHNDSKEGEECDLGDGSNDKDQENEKYHGENKLNHSKRRRYPPKDLLATLMNLYGERGLGRKVVIEEVSQTKQTTEGELKPE